MYTKKHLLAALKKAGLPHTYKTLLRWESAGIIPKPQVIDMQGRQWRVYTDRDIVSVLSAVAKLKS